MANIEVKEANSLVKEYYTEYGRYVLETRALPSIYDGLKYSQRRLIYAASKLPSRFSKSSKILGDTIPYHPHGLDSLYDTLVGMTTQTNRFRLFMGKGNWGGYGFGAAAYRYTEAYLDDYARYAYTQFVDYSDFIEGESGLNEPEFLPALIPYSNIIGSQGIGVGLSTNIMPLNLMETIDYFIATIKGDKNPKAPTPDLGNYIIDMDDNEIDDAVKGYEGYVCLKSIVTQESSNTIVIEEVYNKSIERVLKDVQHYIDEGKIDFRNESSVRPRYVLEIMDPSIKVSEIALLIEKRSWTRSKFTRLVVDKDKAVYSSLKYQVSKTLEYLNHVLDVKFAKELSRLQFQEQVFLAIEYIKSSGLINKLHTMSTQDLIDDLTTNGGFTIDIAKSAISKPITYLTKSHLQELADIRSQINTNKTTNRTDYLVSLYEELKNKLWPLYNSMPHSIRRSKLLKTPRVKKYNDHAIIITNRGKEFDDVLYIITKSGNIILEHAYSKVKKIIDFDLNNDSIVDVMTDKFDKFVLITNYDGILSVDKDSVKYTKKVLNIQGDEYVSEIIGINNNDKGESLFDYKGVTYDANNYTRVRVSKPIYNWIL